MSEGLLGPGVSGSNWTPIVSHDVTHTIGGDVEAVRTRLSDALERVGYRVINETPIQGRRSGTSAGANGYSTDILVYPATLTVGLKSISPGLTRATFAYEIRHAMGYLSKGDRRTLDRESDAIIAVAQAQTANQMCPSCRAPLVGGARFCRQCGSPIQDPDSLAELEILKLTAGINESFKWIGPSVLILLVALLAPYFVLLGAEDSVRFARILKAVFLVSGILGITSLSMLSFGLWKMRGLLARRSAVERMSFPATVQAPALGAPTTSELVHHSITDETTSLLPQEKVSSS